MALGSFRGPSRRSDQLARRPANPIASDRLRLRARYSEVVGGSGLGFPAGFDAAELADMFDRPGVGARARSRWGRGEPYRTVDGPRDLAAIKAAWVRFRAPIKVRTVCTWVLTVPVEIPRASAISWFDFPRASWASTSS